eukprot:684250-Amphidinium_carterae.1
MMKKRKTHMERLGRNPQRLLQEDAGGAPCLLGRVRWMWRCEQPSTGVHRAKQIDGCAPRKCCSHATAALTWPC